jgi:hypothetical protein
MRNFGKISELTALLLRKFLSNAAILVSLIFFLDASRSYEKKYGPRTRNKSTSQDPHTAGMATYPFSRLRAGPSEKTPLGGALLTNGLYCHP